MTPTDFSVISGIPFGIRLIELYDDWRIDISSDRMVELIGIDLPWLAEPGFATPALSISRRWLSLQAPGIYARYGRGELTATQVARFTLLLLFASTFWSNRKEKFNPSILKSLENLALLEDPPAFREVSLEGVDRTVLPSKDITKVPVGLVNQMMELFLGMQQELAAAWTQMAFGGRRPRR
ncbi:hypothetical protein JCGZ_15005 [Jatropha curcas]|uniref:Aminotransferase-like plant mobile domain-containing protein n=1 Tax=Jatropha curcas TaxID=180498 RepID=A0A067KHK3_JATCU|nr:hypothetical protein JCGZ_15005 [Jatropha curcas]